VAPTSSEMEKINDKTFGGISHKLEGSKNER
jgi:hypothetical protein